MGVVQRAGHAAAESSRRHKRVTRAQASRRAREAAFAELATLADRTEDAGVACLARALTTLRDAPLRPGTAETIARRDPAFAEALARAFDLADEVEGAA